MMSTRQSLGGLNKSAFWDVWHGTSLFKQRIAYPFGAIATSAFCGRKSVMRPPFSSPTLALLQPALRAWKHIHRVAMPSVDENSALVGLEMGKSLGTGEPMPLWVVWIFSGWIHCYAWSMEQIIGRARPSACSANFSQRRDSCWDWDGWSCSHLNAGWLVASRWTYLIV